MMDIIEQNKHLLWNCDFWECILMMIIKSKWIFIMLFMNNVDYPTWRIFLWLVWALGAVLSFLKIWHSGCLKEKCIIAVFSSTFIMSIYVNSCGSAISLHVLDLLNLTRQCKIRFLDINMNFTEQNIHVLCNTKSYECHLIKIIKG